MLPTTLLVAVVWIAIVVLPIWLVIKGISLAGRKRGWGLRQYVLGVVLFVPLWFAVIMRYFVGAMPEDILKYTIIAFLMAAIYGLGLLGWEQFFRDRARRSGKQ